MALDCSRWFLIAAEWTRMIDVPNLAGDISPRTVEDGFKALLAVEAYLKAGGGPQLAALCGAFYTYGLSPHIVQLSAQHVRAHHGALSLQVHPSRLRPFQGATADVGGH